LEGDLLSISVEFTSILQENLTFRYSIVKVFLVKNEPCRKSQFASVQ